MEQLALPKRRMTAEEFEAWLSQRPGDARFELSQGKIIAMASERVAHALVKVAAFDGLRAASRHLDRETLPDGMAVRIGDATQREPDAALRCGPRLPLDATYYTDPVVIVEVLSPSTASVDESMKMFDYARVPSLAHYLIVDTTQRLILHHRRTADGFFTSILPGGTLELDPPGLTLDLGAVLAPLD